ncbi:MAG: xanthine dehydrogenase family protein molybdopterin-binding subunit, partial [Solirubrobacterales bacterium]
ALVRSVDVSGALSRRGVSAVLTADDLPDSIKPAPSMWQPEGTEVLVPEWYPLASDRVACVGAPIAVVIAGDRYTAEDAAEDVIVDYEPLDAVVGIEAALADGAPLAHPELGTNRCYEWSLGGGDVVAGLAEADVIVERTINNHLIAGTPMEGRGVVADWHGDRVTLWTSTQNPHLVRRYMTAQLGWPEHRLRVIVPDVGGAFGVKGNLYGEETLIAWCAEKVGAPVKWVEDRRENLISSNHSRGQIQHVRLGAKRDGTITALDTEIHADLGAYHLLFTPFIPTITAVVASGCYAIPAIRTSIIGLFTNTYPTDAYRGAGRPEAAHLIEVMMEQLAAELDLGVLEVRRRNFIQPEDFPAERPHGPVYDSGNYDGSLDRLLEHLDLESFRAEQASLREQGIHRGVGFSTYMEASGLGPSSLAGPALSGIDLAFWESAVVRVSPDGSVTVQTGSVPAGQGHETTFAQLVADRVGAHPKDVKVVWGDTDSVPNGMGTYGSRSIVVGGEAAAIASDRVVAKARTIAAELLETSPEDIELTDGRFGVRGSPANSMSLAEVARHAHAPYTLSDDFEPGLEASCHFDPPSFVHPFGAHAAIVEVDLETGGVTLLRYVAVDDVGNVINPQLVDGQIKGGIVQAVAQAMFESVHFGPDGQPLTTSLLDYALPTAAELPDMETDRTVTPSPHNSLGVKGAGEAGTIGGTPAVVNAVTDALRPLGVELMNMPLSPDAILSAIGPSVRTG